MWPPALNSRSLATAATTAATRASLGRDQIVEQPHVIVRISAIRYVRPAQDAVTTGLRAMKLLDQLMAVEITTWCRDGDSIIIIVIIVVIIVIIVIVGAAPVWCLRPARLQSYAVGGVLEEPATAVSAERPIIYNTRISST